MNVLGFSYQNIVDNNGIGIAVTGMLIVFATLTFITIFISYLPKILKSLEGILPEEGAGHGHHAAAAPQGIAALNTNSDQVQDEVVAAIGYVLHQRKNNS